jgi:hypothetical protein
MLVTDSESPSRQETSMGTATTKSSSVFQEIIVAGPT